MRNIVVVLQYNGYNYHGWQQQENAVTIQQTVREAIESIVGESVVVYGCGRTDAGVHAKRYVCNFKTSAKIPADKLPYALNNLFPKDIRALDAYDVDEDFHSVFSAKAKRYQYKIINNTFGDVFLCDLAWHYKYDLDVDKMHRAAQAFLGEHDFSAFCATGGSVTDHVRTIYEISVKRQGDVITVDVCGNGFLYNMVRIITGTLVYVGAGKIDENEVGAIIDSCDRERAGITAPPQGLYMTEAYYGDNIKGGCRYE